MMFKKTLFFLFCFLFNFFLSYSFAQTSTSNFTCGNNRMKIFTERTSNEVTEDFCYNAFERTLYSVTKCSKDPCMATLKGPFKIAWSHLKGERGSPSAKACVYLKGTPESLEIFDQEKKRWVASSRCLFPDASYLDLGTLMSRVEILEDK